jgi:hypothetical protein
MMLTGSCQVLQFDTRVLAHVQHCTWEACAATHSTFSPQLRRPPQRQELVMLRHASTACAGTSHCTHRAAPKPTPARQPRSARSPRYNQQIRHHAILPTNQCRLNDIDNRQAPTPTTHCCTAKCCMILCKQGAHSTLECGAFPGTCHGWNRTSTCAPSTPLASSCAPGEVRCAR